MATTVFQDMLLDARRARGGARFGVDAATEAKLLSAGLTPQQIQEADAQRKTSVAGIPILPVAGTLLIVGGAVYFATKRRD